MCRRCPTHDTPLQMHAVICCVPRSSDEFLMSVGIVLRKEVFKAVCYSVIVARSVVVRGQRVPLYLNLALISRLNIKRCSHVDDTPCSLYCGSAHTRNQTLALENTCNRRAVLSSAHLFLQQHCCAVAYPGILFGWGSNKFSSGQRTDRTGIWGR